MSRKKMWTTLVLACTGRNTNNQIIDKIAQMVVDNDWKVGVFVPLSKNKLMYANVKFSNKNDPIDRYSTMTTIEIANKIKSEICRVKLEGCKCKFQSTLNCEILLNIN